MNTLRLTGVLLMGAGLGWIGGHFSAPFHPFWFGLSIDVIHLLPIYILVIFSSKLLKQPLAPSSAHSISVITVLAVLVKLVTIFMIIWAVTHPNGFGPHTAADWIPIGMTNMGAGIWFLTVVARRFSTTTADRTA